MSTVIRFSRFGKIAALTTAAGGSLYLFRDEIKPYITSSQRSSLKQSSNKLNQNVTEPKGLIENLPEQVPYLLVGGGTASHSAMRAIRAHDPKAKVLIVGSEDKTPYMRPMLSKDLWFTDQEARRDLKFGWIRGRDRSIFYECPEFYLPLDMMQNRETGGVSMIKNMRVTHLDPDKKTAHLENGQQVRYDKCLLAPGGKPKSLPVFENASDEVKERVLHFRTADDFLRLEKISESVKKIVIIGGGFLGSELACALANRSPEDNVPKDQVIYQVFPESGILDKILPEQLSQFVSKKIEAEGVKLIPKVEVKMATLKSDKSIVLRLSDGQVLEADFIVCAVGLEPDVELARSSGLEVDENTGGYLVNSELEARTSVWVAGDASCFYDRKLGRRRVEHHDHAINSGKLAGENMTGAGKAYTHQSMFWSEIGRDISFEAVGIIDSSLNTAMIFADPVELASLEKETFGASGEGQQNQSSVQNSQLESDEAQNKQSNVPKSVTALPLTRSGVEDQFVKGVVFYLKDGIIVGILLWNLFSRLTIARRILSEQRRYEDFEEVAKMFNIYLDDMKTV